MGRALLLSINKAAASTAAITSSDFDTGFTGADLTDFDSAFVAEFTSGAVVIDIDLGVARTIDIGAFISHQFEIRGTASTVRIQGADDAAISSNVFEAFNSDVNNSTFSQWQTPYNVYMTWARTSRRYWRVTITGAKNPFKLGQLFLGEIVMYDSNDIASIVTLPDSFITNYSNGIRQSQLNDTRRNRTVAGSEHGFTLSQSWRFDNVRFEGIDENTWAQIVQTISGHTLNRMDAFDDVPIESTDESLLNTVTRPLLWIPRPRFESFAATGLGVDCYYVVSNTDDVRATFLPPGNILNAGPLSFTEQSRGLGF